MFFTVSTPQAFKSESIPLEQGLAVLEEKMNTHNQDATPQKRAYKKTKWNRRKTYTSFKAKSRNTNK